ncbi:MAG: hypothetical protein HFI30_17105 [Lachnospiraceae bacterium]|jgi:hypothetical protein|nr:hypothetical protein [Lachnospiraceae bacterium]
MKANTICKYSKCSLGPNGGQKRYYSCGYCAATENWKSMACCREHYQLYIAEVLAARERGEAIDLLPDRTDLTKEEIQALKQKPLLQIKKETEEELREYADENGCVSIPEAVDAINKALEKEDSFRQEVIL